MAIDGDGPLAHFPQSSNQEDPFPDQPRGKSVSSLRLQRLVKKLGPGCLGVTFNFNEEDPIEIPEAEVASLSPAD